MTEPARLRRATRMVALQVALVLGGLLMLVGVVLYAVDLRFQHQQIDGQLAQVAARVDDTDDPPPGMAIGIVDQGTGRVVVSDRAPEPTADSTHGPIGYRDLRAGDVDYRVLVTERPGRRIAVLVDQRPWQAGRQRLLEALLVAELTGGVAAVGAAVLLSRRAIRPLTEALALQHRFIADASHELRAPLTVLHTRAQLLARRAEREQLPGPWREQLDGLVTDTRALSGIIDDLLLTAAADHHPDRVESVDLAALCREVAGSFEAHAQTLGVAVGVETVAAGAEATIDGVRPALRRAMFALVDNALQHEQSGGSVSIRLARTRSDVLVTISDTGAGLEPRDAGRLFERFAHGDGHTAGVRPHGIGLALVQAVVEAHRGHITVDGAPGHGAEFTLVLPARTDVREFSKNSDLGSR
ncbi:sensor histidine kinase [Nocardia stercoris]|uniref:histidine kinase n=1 Tax=Nocardia stercoris TaxID=2483361 RepID=A0A3M2LC38_9NOCA|nr:HAMP domain-containing sensor histidine kinase [Nocardia stercoris]RMI33535.1 sensor histidine kinase [Nocardia stercoris]